MSYVPTKRVMGNASSDSPAIDWLTIRTNGAANPTIIEGTLKNWVLSVTYSSNQWLVAFKPDFAIKAPASLFSVSMVQDTVGAFLAQNLGYNATTKTLTIGFSAAATPATPAAPPAAGTRNAVNIAALITY